MKSMKLNESLYWVGVLDKDLRVFDIIMYTEFGTTYNSYVLKGSEKTALFESAKEKFFDEYIETVKQITPIEEIEYLIVDHTEPDHAGSIEKILEINPNIKIVGSAVAISFLKHIVNREFCCGEGRRYSEPGQQDDPLLFRAESALAGYDLFLYRRRRRSDDLRFLRLPLRA